MFYSFYTKLAGVTFGDCRKNINKWGYADIGYFWLERERDNPHDPNAISVWFLNDRLGYLQKIDKGKRFSVSIRRKMSEMISGRLN